MNQLHPEFKQLSDFALGRLEAAQLDAVENHLAECPSCCDTLNQIKEDTFVGLVRQAKDDGRDSDRASPGDTDLDTPMTADVGQLVQSLQVRQEVINDMAAALAGAATQAHAQSANAAAGTTEPAAAIQVADIPVELANHTKFRIEALIGTGGMGAVYKAEHRMMKRTVALKVINPKFMQSKQAVERFHREVQAAARLQHPNIVTAHDAEEAGGLHYLVMEYVPGTDLQKVLEERGPLPITEACEYIRQAALGLQHAHENGMVHRDIKPQNLMLSGARSASEGSGQPSLALRAPATVKILDFGLASLTETTAEESTQSSNVESQKSGLTQAGALMGTPDYMAPEQAKDARRADIRSDIYSLGCTLYALLAGKVPFPGGTAIDKVIAHSTNQATPIREFRKDVPPALVNVLEMMMAKAPQERYQTPAEVAAAMTPFTRAGAKAAIEADVAQRIEVVRAMRTLREPTRGILGVAAMAILFGLGGLMLGLLGMPAAEVMAVKLRLAALSNLLYGACLFPIGLMVRFVRWRPLALPGLVTFGIGLPLATAAFVNWAFFPSLAILMPQFIGVVVVAWTIYLLCRVDIREPFAIKAGFAPNRLHWLTGIGAAGIAAAAAGIILYLQTADGVVRFEINDSAIKVILDKDAAKIIGAVSQPITLRAADHSLIIQHGKDLEFPATNFTLKRGTETRLRIDWLNKDKLVMAIHQDGQLLREMDRPGGAPQQSSLLDGGWKAVAFEKNGQPVLAEELRKEKYPAFLTIQGKRLAVMSTDGRRHESTLTIQTDRNPNWIDVKGPLFEGLPDMHGIFKVEGDTATLSIIENDQPRPPVFSTKRMRNLLIVMRRMTEGEYSKSIKEFADTVGSASRSDAQRILGAWRPVSVQVYDKRAPQIMLDRGQLRLTFSLADKLSVKVSLDNMPIPFDQLKEAIKGLGDKAPTLHEFLAVLEKKSVEAVWSVDDTKTPKTINITYLSPIRKTLLGIYSLEGDTLKVCLTLDPDRADQRPKELAPGPGVVFGTLERVPATEQKTGAANDPLQGVWKSTMVGGAAHTDVTIQGNRFILKRTPRKPDPQPHEIKTEVDGVLQLDTTAEPRRIKVVDPKSDATLLLGIYRLNGDSLDLCFRRSGDTYPTSFATNPQAGQEFVSLHRTKMP